MKHSDIPLTRDLVLVGGGHSHALFLRKWGMKPLPGVRVTVINPGPTAPYSGMLPGFVAGHYDRSALDIDLVKLARFAGARVVLGAAFHIDRTAREVHVKGRPPIAFDVASIDVGITSHMPDLAGFSEFAIPAKPLGPFARDWAVYRGLAGSASAAVIGGGVAGAELAMAMAFALHQRDRNAKVHLLDRGEILGEFPAETRAKLRLALEDSGVSLHEQAHITQLTDGQIHLASGQIIPAGFITGAAGARPYEWLANAGVQMHDGFIKINEHLQSSDPSIFAVGDCAHMVHAPRPKAGVYAVRQAPVLFQNVRAALGAGEMTAYHPQKDYLKLISLGEKSALMEKLGRAYSGRILWRWKNHIDQTFMNKFKSLPDMPVPKTPPEIASGVREFLGSQPLCGGCGSKVGHNVLAQVTSGLSQSRDDITLNAGDDAAILDVGGQKQVLTTDHLRAICEDPAVMARIAAIHALGDIWAMGATPQAVLTQVTLPRMTKDLQHRSLNEIMHGASQIFGDAGADIVGGHTTMGAEMQIGFSITGLLDRAPITVSGALPGDVLILTKPIGSGTLLAAEMRGLADGADIADCYELLLRGQGDASKILAQAHAMTDVTGFGLMGHLHNICVSSAVGAQIDVSAVPFMSGALDLAKRGIRSTIYQDNRAILPELDSSPEIDLLFDPQTAGGLLAAVDHSQANDILQNLLSSGHRAAVIGQITAGSEISLS